MPARPHGQAGGLIPDEDRRTSSDEPDVRRVEVGARSFVVVGTAHVSRESTVLVRSVVERESPDVVCVELDEARLKALTRPQDWQALDLKQLIRSGQLPTLLAHLLLASYQKRLGRELGVAPGAELLEAVRAAEERGIPVELCDRNVRVTMLRAWRELGWWNKNKLLAAMLLSVFGGEKLSEEDLRELRRQDVLSRILEDLAREMPELKRVLLDERDSYLAERIRRAAGSRVVAVVGAGHLEGVARALRRAEEVDLAPMETIPSSASIARYVGWLVPTAVVAALLAVAFTRGADVAGENVRFWILATGIPCALGAVLALAHPLTIVAAFVAAPITTLHPLLGAGYVTALVQLWAHPPRVRDFESVSDEMLQVGAWWRNRLLRVFLAFVLPTFGAIAGVWIGGARILRELL